MPAVKTCDVSCCRWPLCLHMSEWYRSRAVPVAMSQVLQGHYLLRARLKLSWAETIIKRHWKRKVRCLHCLEEYYTSSRYSCLISCPCSLTSFYLSEFHFIHAFASVPMQERFAPKHSSKLLSDSFEQFLYSGAITNESTRHLQSTRRDVADRGLDIVGDPFHEVGTVLVLNIQHLFIHFLHGHTATKHGCHRQITTVPWITCSHHVLDIKHLLS